MKTKYRALRFVVSLYRILAWVVLVLGVLGAIAMIVAGVVQGSRGASVPMMQWHRYGPGGFGLVGGIVGGVCALIGTALAFIAMWAGSEFVAMLMDIEENTRETAYYLKGELEAIPPREEPAAWQQPTPNA